MTYIIDTDSHAVEAPDLWTTRMSSTRWGDSIPHVRYVPERDCDVWFVDEKPIMPVGFTVIERGSNGEVQRNEENFPNFVSKVSEMHASAFDPRERAKVMDAFGINQAVLYPNLGFVGPDIYRVAENSELEFQVGIAQAYNDWIYDWERQEPDHFLSLACLPYWDIDSAVAEVERCAELGHHGFVMTGVPELHGEPYLADPHWNPLWAAAQATGLPISFHSGGGGPVSVSMTSSNGKVTQESALEDRMRVAGKLSTVVLLTCTELMKNGITVAELLMSGILPRYPDLKFVSVEGGVGWIPYVLESLDVHAMKYRVSREHPEFTELPSFYFHRQVFANTWYESLTDYHEATIGSDNILFETDFPHPTCLIGDEIDAAVATVTGNLKPEAREKILWRNAAELFHADVKQRVDTLL